MSRKAKELRDQRIHSLVGMIIGATSDDDSGPWFWVDTMSSNNPRSTTEEAIARASAHRLQAFLHDGVDSVPADAREALEELQKIQANSSWWGKQTFHMTLNKSVQIGLEKGTIKAKSTILSSSYTLTTE